MTATSAPAVAQATPPPAVSPPAAPPPVQVNVEGQPGPAS